MNINLKTVVLICVQKFISILKSNLNINERENNHRSLKSKGIKIKLKS